MGGISEDNGAEKKDPFDDDYIGNIWGWKFSVFGLILILILGGIMVYRHYALGVPFSEGLTPEPEKTEMPADTLKGTRDAE